MNRFSLIIQLVLCLAAATFAQDTRLKILEQPKPELPQNHSTSDIQGTVILNVEFLDFGGIGEVTPVRSLPAGLTEKAIAAAKKIKFEPEKHEGKAVTVTQQLEYAYSWNGGWSFPKNNKDFSSPAIGDARQAEAIIAKAIQSLGGDKYLQIRSQVGRGKFSILREGGIVSFQSFVDVIVFPDKERTDFKGGGARTIQANSGSTGWLYDDSLDTVKVQNETQIANFRQGLRTSLDHLLHGYSKADGELSYIGKRQATLGKRNDVIRLSYRDGFVVEFEFADDGLPQKTIYKHSAADGESKEEDRFAQFIEVAGVKTPFVIDHFIDGQQSSRINYESVEFNKTIPDSIFTKPTSPKDAKKDLKF